MKNHKVDKPETYTILGWCFYFNEPVGWLIDRWNELQEKLPFLRSFLYFTLYSPFLFILSYFIIGESKLTMFLALYVGFFVSMILILIIIYGFVKFVRFLYKVVDDFFNRIFNLGDD